MTKKKQRLWKLSGLFRLEGTPGNWSSLRNRKRTRKLQKILVFLKLSGYSESQIKPILTEMIKSFEYRASKRGLLDSVKHFKNVYSFCQRYAVSHKADALRWTKSDENNFPYVAYPVKSLLEGSLKDRKSGLFILSFYKIVDTYNDEIDYQSITDPPSNGIIECKLELGGYFNELVNVTENNQLKNKLRLFNICYIQVIKELFPISNLQQRIDKLKSLSDIYVSAKQGPNGPSLSSTPLDFEAIRNSKDGILNSVQEISCLTENKDLTEIINSFLKENDVVSKNPVVTSRLSLKQEKGGKNRIFAIVDWFTQSALLGMHKFLFNWLGNQPGDGTFRHNRVALVLKDWTNGVIDIETASHSVDLSKATDRIPSLLIREIMSEIFGKELGSLWHKVLVERDFQKINRNDPTDVVRYMTGQPMGALSSWANLALWHHIMLLTCLKYNKLEYLHTPNDPYYIVIGDDVAVKGHKMYKVYMDLVLGAQGISSSPTKGFTPETYVPGLNPLGDNDESIHAGEVAKRVFLNGYEITPIRPDLLGAGLEFPQNFPDLLTTLNQRGYEEISTTPVSLSLAAENYKPKWSVAIASNPLLPSPAINRGMVVNEEMKSLASLSPWLSENWTEDHNNIFKTIFWKSLKLKLNESVADTYQLILPYLEESTNSCVETLSFQAKSQGYPMVFIKVYHKAIRLVEDWAVNLTEDERKFWTGEEITDVQALNAYIRKALVVFDITLAVEGKRMKLDDRNFASRLILDITKDVLKELPLINSETSQGPR